MYLKRNIAFVFLSVITLYLTNVLSYTNGEKHYQRLDKSALVIVHWKIAAGRFRCLYYYEKGQKNICLDSIKRINKEKLFLVKEYHKLEIKKSGD